MGLQGHSLPWVITMYAGRVFLYDQGVLGSIISGTFFLDALMIAPDDRFRHVQHIFESTWLGLMGEATIFHG